MSRMKGNAVTRGITLGILGFLMIYLLRIIDPIPTKTKLDAIDVDTVEFQSLSGDYELQISQQNSNVSSDGSVYFPSKNFTFSTSFLSREKKLRDDEHDPLGEQFDVQKLDEKLFKQFPSTFDERFKNPCWYDQKTLRCVPYFYLIGFAKCGTTDLWSKLVKHPQIQGTPKEPHWWAKRRVGWTGTPIHVSEVKKIRKMTGVGNDAPLEWYLNWFSTYGVSNIEKDKKKVLGDGSVTTVWGLEPSWKELYPTSTEPPYVMANLMHELQPNAKIIVIVREPVQRHYSAYLYCGGKNADKFHLTVQKNLECHTTCEKSHSPRYCAYTSPECKLFRGMYYIFLRDWIDAFGRDSIYIVTLNDWMGDSLNQYTEISKFLDLDIPTDEEIRQIISRKVKNSQSNKKQRAGVLRPDTKKILQDFYRPWNHKLAELLNDTKFLWDY